MRIVDLGRLERERRLDIEVEFPADSDLWEGDPDLSFQSPVRVQGTATLLHGGEVLVAGDVSGTLARECRRCLEDASEGFAYEVAWYFVPEEALEEGDDGESRPIPAGTDELDLGSALREELMLRVPRYSLCAEDCAGLCPTCGTNRNESECACGVPEADPRWEALRKHSE